MMEVVSERSEDTGASGGPIDPSELVHRIRQWAMELGFAAVGVSELDVAQPAARLSAWLAREFHGQMSYMRLHEAVRADPAPLLPRARRAICVRVDYRPRGDGDGWIDPGGQRLGRTDAAG